MLTTADKKLFQMPLKILATEALKEIVILESYPLFVFYAILRYVLFPRLIPSPPSGFSLE